MASAMSPALECPICLDKFRNPVVTPCGHLSCEACVKTHVRASRDPYEATCPTCRAPFPIVIPDMSMIPKKYHVFISPSLRRVYLGDGEDNSRTIIDNLNTEIAILRARVGMLKRDKDLLMDRCEAAQSALSRLTSDERAARLELNKAREDVRLANQNLENLRVDYRALKSRDSNSTPVTKRKSGQAALDTSALNDSPNPSSTIIKNYFNGRPIKPIPKRMKRSQHSYSSPPLSSAGTSTASRLSAHNASGTVTRHTRTTPYLSCSSSDESSSNNERSDSEDSIRSPSTYRRSREPPPPPPTLRRVLRRSERLERSSTS